MLKKYLALFLLLAACSNTTTTKLTSYEGQAHDVCAKYGELTRSGEFATCMANTSSSLAQQNGDADVAKALYDHWMLEVKRAQEGDGQLMETQNMNIGKNETYCQQQENVWILRKKEYGYETYYNTAIKEVAAQTGCQNLLKLQNKCLFCD